MSERAWKYKIGDTFTYPPCPLFKITLTKMPDKEDRYECYRADGTDIKGESFTNAWYDEDELDKYVLAK